LTSPVSINDVSIRDIWLVTLDDAEGHEQEGTRPVIIINVHPQSKLSMVTPCTGQMRASRFPHTHQISPTTTNGLTRESIGLVYQSRALSTTRFIKKMGKCSDTDFEAIQIILGDYCGI
jgi:mRNA interferase MazF